MRLSYFYMICAMTLLDAVLLIASILNRKKKAATSFIATLILIIVAQSFYGSSLVLADLRLKFFVHELKFIGVAYFSVSFFSMYMIFFDKEKLASRRNLFLLGIIPGLSVILAVTNNYHHLFRRELYLLENAYGSFVGVESGPLFWVYIIYVYSIYLFGIAVIIQAYFKTPRIYRMQIGIMVFAAVSTLIINFISISGIFFEDFGDATLISFTFAATIQFYGLILYKPTRMIQLARSMAVNELKNPTVIFDYESAFMDANIAARGLFGPDIYEGCEDFLKNRLGLAALPPEKETSEYEVMVDDLYYAVNLKRITDSDGTFAGYVLMMNNLTEMKSRERELEVLAGRDYLTGIANRHALRQELSMIRGEVLPLAVIHFNISGMKKINRNLGYDHGDKTIKRTAIVLAETENSFCARLGGDDFVLLCKNTSESEAYRLIDEIKRKLRERYDISLIAGLAVKRTNMDNIHIVIKTSLNNLHRNKVIQTKTDVKW